MQLYRTRLSEPVEDHQPIVVIGCEAKVCDSETKAEQRSSPATAIRQLHHPLRRYAVRKVVGKYTQDIRRISTARAASCVHCWILRHQESQATRTSRMQKDGPRNPRGTDIKGARNQTRAPYVFKNRPRSSSHPGWQRKSGSRCLPTARSCCHSCLHCARGCQLNRLH